MSEKAKVRRVKQDGWSFLVFATLVGMGLSGITGNFLLFLTFALASAYCMLKVDKWYGFDITEADWSGRKRG